MITLNLIPAHDKQELRLLRVFLAIKNVVSLALIGLTTVAVGLVAARMFLQNYFTYLIASSSLRRERSRTATTELKALKTDLTAVQSIQAGYVPWSRLLVELSAQVNDGITLTDLKVSQDGQAELSGVAERREDLLRFRDRLVSSGLTADFTIPLATKFQEVDIKFRLAVTIRIPRLESP